jgi:hypothetical protein
MMAVVAAFIFVHHEIRVPSDAVFGPDGRAVRQFYSPGLGFPPVL